MITRGTYQSLLALLVTTACLPAVVGCGDSRPVAQIRGKVVGKNGALPGAAIRVVRFEPTANSKTALRKGASGSINDDGSFELFTRKPGDGVNHGEYAVTFAFFRSATDQRPLIAAKYTKPATTPYKLVVDKDLDDLVFEVEPPDGVTP